MAVEPYIWDTVDRADENFYIIHYEVRLIKVALISISIHYLAW